MVIHQATNNKQHDYTKDIVDIMKLLLKENYHCLMTNFSLRHSKCNIKNSPRVYQKRNQGTMA